jgi:hypothetical protein
VKAVIKPDGSIEVGDATPEEVAKLAEERRRSGMRSLSERVTPDPPVRLGWRGTYRSQPCGACGHERAVHFFKHGPGRRGLCGTICKCDGWIPLAPPAPEPLIAGPLPPQSHEEIQADAERFIEQTGLREKLEKARRDMNFHTLTGQRGCR